MDIPAPLTTHDLINFDSSSNSIDAWQIVLSTNPSSLSCSYKANLLD